LHNAISKYSSNRCKLSPDTRGEYKACEVFPTTTSKLEHGAVVKEVLKSIAENLLGIELLSTSIGKV
jgi:hypothetical protein